MWWLIWATLPGIFGTQIYETTVFVSVLLGMSMRLFPEEIWTNRIEEDHKYPLHCGWAVSNSLRDWKEQEGKKVYSTACAGE